MRNPSEIENEIDTIRDAIYLITKEMTPQERVAYINLRAHEILNKRKIPEQQEKLQNMCF